MLKDLFLPGVFGCADDGNRKMSPHLLGLRGETY